MLSETTIATLFGAAIGIIPSIVIVVVESMNQRRRERHELAIKRMELIEAPRLEALQEFTLQAGALISGKNEPDFSRAHFVAALSKVSMYVSPETMHSIQEAYPIIVRGWETSTTNTSSDKLETEAVRRMLDCLHAEMESTFQNQSNKRRRAAKKSAK